LHVVARRAVPQHSHRRRQQSQPVFSVMALAYHAGIASGIVSGMENEAKVRENRIRRKAERQGYKLEKSRRRDPDATDYGMFTLTSAKGTPRTFKSIDAVEKFLTR
jgi:hypothetical protein